MWLRRHVLLFIGCIILGGHEFLAVKVEDEVGETSDAHQRRLQQHASVGDILLNMVNPGHLAKSEKIGVTTVSRLPKNGATGEETAQASRSNTISGSDRGSSATKIQTSSSIGGKGGGGLGGNSGAATPQETAVLSVALENAWAQRSLFRPRLPRKATNPNNLDKTSSSAERVSSIPKTIVARLPLQPPELLASLRVGRGHHPIDGGNDDGGDDEKGDEHVSSVANGDQKEQVSGEEGSSSGTTEKRKVPLLALIHPCTLAWPARLDVLVTALVALESAGEGSGKFDLVVVLDSKGEKMGKHDCNAKASSMLTPVGKQGPGLGGVGGKDLLCDSFQLLQQGGVPFVLAVHHTEVSQAHHQPPQPHRQGSALDQKHAQWMAGAAAVYARDHGYSELVVASSASLIGSGTVTALAKAVQVETTTAASAHTRVVAIPILAGSADGLTRDHHHHGDHNGDHKGKSTNHHHHHRRQLLGDAAGDGSGGGGASGGGRGGGSGVGVGCGLGGRDSGVCLRSLHPTLEPALLAFAEHPLSFQRTTQGLQQAASTSTPLLVDPASLVPSSSRHASSSPSSSSCEVAGVEAALGLVSALATDTALRLMGLPSLLSMNASSSSEFYAEEDSGWPVVVRNPPPLPLDSCRALDAVGAMVRVHKAAFAVSHVPEFSPALLRNDPTPHKAALFRSPEPPSLSGPKTGDVIASAAAASVSAAAAGSGAASSAFPTSPNYSAVLKNGVQSGGGGGQGGPSRRSRTLVCATCAGVWHRTLSLLLSLEGSKRDDFDFLLAVTPRDDDPSDEFARAAGIATLVQPEPIGLTDLWNQVVKYGLAHGYENVFIVNNDVLAGDGAVSALVSALDSGLDLVTPSTRFGAGIMQCALYGSGGKKKGGDSQVDGDLFLSNPLNYARVGASLVGTHSSTLSQRHAHPSSSANLGYMNTQHTVSNKVGMLGPISASHKGPNKKKALPEPLPGLAGVGEAGPPTKYGAVSTGTFMAFFFGMRTSWVKQHLLEDGSGRLWNDTRWKNYNQEASLSLRTQVKAHASVSAFVYHFRGSTLEAGPCKNGWLDCATWQKGHRPDMDSTWFDSKKTGLRNK